MRFTVCIPATRPNTLGTAIASVQRQTFEDWELVVVGQGSPAPIAAAVEVAAAGDPRVRLHHIQRRGLSIARNAAVAVSTGEIIAYIDDDCEAAQDWLAVLDTCFGDPSIGLVGGSLVAPLPTRRIGSCPEFLAEELVYDPVTNGGRAPEGWGLVGGNFAVRRSTSQEVGDFDEHLGAGTEFAAAEETDYMLRLELLGVTMMTTPRSIVRHTYGYRYGFKAVYRHKRDYARGNGALAAKQTMLGDDRGTKWIARDKSAALSLLRSRRVLKAPASLLRVWHLQRGYGACHERYIVHPGPEDPVRSVLRRSRTLDKTSTA